MISLALTETQRTELIAWIKEELNSTLAQVETMADEELTDYYYDHL